MDRRTILALAIAMLTIQAYFLWFAPKPPEADTPVAGNPIGPVGEPGAEGEPVAAAPSAPASDLPVRDVPVEWCSVSGVVTTDGGYLRDVKLADRQADYKAQAWWQWIWASLGGDRQPWIPYHLDGGPAVVLSPEAQMLGVGSGALDAAAPRVEVVQQDEAGLVLRGVTGELVETTAAYREREDCVVEVEVTWKNVGTGTYNGNLWLTAHDAMGEAAGRYSHTTRRPIGMTEGSVERWHDHSDLDSPQRYEGKADWFGLADSYFGSFVIAGTDAKGLLVYSARPTAGAKVYGEHYLVSTTLAPGAAYTETFRFYVGPLETTRLAVVDSRLDDAVDYGWFAFFARPLLWALRGLHGLVGNWGIAIVLATFALKMVFFPLTSMAMRSSQAMQNLQPKLAELREKFADNQEELNRRTIELFRENGVNPVGGCLPMLVQIPVFIAFYNVLLSSVELYQTEFLYLKDLSSVDPYAALPAAVVVLMWAQQQMMPTTANLDPAQQKIMKWMPIIFGLFFFTSPSGLVVYFFVNMLLTIVQQWLIKRTMISAATA